MNAQVPQTNVIRFPGRPRPAPAAPHAACGEIHYHAAAVREEAAKQPRQLR